MVTRTIAVIDDDASVRRAFSRLLRAAGFDVSPYASGQEFLDSRDDPRPDCAVLDMHMPGLSGLELQQRLNETGVRIPMIVITADMELQSCQAALDEGAVAYLRKPVDGPELLECLERAIAKAPGKTSAGKVPQSKVRRVAGAR